MRESDGHRSACRGALGDGTRRSRGRCPIVNAIVAFNKTALWRTFDRQLYAARDTCVTRSRIEIDHRSTGASNIALGGNAGTNVTTASSVICIGASGANVSNGCYIGQIFGATSSGGTAVFINSSGQLGTATS
jgi:hypothetical protein